MLALIKMKNLVTIATFTLPTDLAIAKGILESKNIECVIEDELTVQVYNFISNAVGGVKLKVHTDNLEDAKSILIEAGFYTEEKIEQSKFWTFIDKMTRDVPFLKNKSLDHRIYLLIWIVILGFISIFMLFLIIFYFLGRL